MNYIINNIEFENGEILCYNYATHKVHKAIIMIAQIMIVVQITGSIDNGSIG